jgi:hypothetical protein
MHQSLSLEQLKMEAQKRSHLVIRREGETAWLPLKSWSGHQGAANAVEYLLVGNKVPVSTCLENDVHCYRLG